jgi:hypothetical protein
MPNISLDARKESELATDAGTWSVYAAQTGDDSSASYNVYGVIVRDGLPYIVTATTTDEDLVALMVEYIFVPALKGFEVGS